MGWTWKLAVALQGPLVVGLAVFAASPVAIGVVIFAVVWRLPVLIGGNEAMRPVLERLASLRAPFGPPEDEVWRLCAAASLFQEHFKAYQVRTLENRRAFEAACWRALPSMDRAARVELDARLRSGRLSQTLRAPPRRPARPYVQPWRACAAPWRRKTPRELEGGAAKIFAKAGVLPLQERVVRAADVREAFKRAEVVKFDARGLLPARMFNTSVGELHSLHADHDVVFHGSTDERHGFESAPCFVLLISFTVVLAHAGPGSLLEWLLERGLTDGLLHFLCHRHWTLEEISVIFKNFQPAGFHSALSRKESVDVLRNYKLLCHKQRGLLGSNINVQRLANWTRGAADTQELARKLGLGGLVEHAHNFLWMGTVAGGLHYDIQDNVLVQITGLSEVFLVPANCSLRIDVGAGGASVDADWIREQGKDLAFFVVRLKPGDGLAIPSHTMHVVTSQDPKRVGMNFFLEPRHGHMRWPWAPANFYNSADRGHLAMRDLWTKTVKELWQTRERGAPSFIIHGQRQEIV